LQGQIQTRTRAQTQTQQHQEDHTTQTSTPPMAPKSPLQVGPRKRRRAASKTGPHTAQKGPTKTEGEGGRTTKGLRSTETPPQQGEAEGENPRLNTPAHKWEARGTSSALQSLLRPSSRSPLRPQRGSSAAGSSESAAAPSLAAPLRHRHRPLHILVPTVPQPLQNTPERNLRPQNAPPTPRTSQRAGEKPTTRGEQSSAQGAPCQAPRRPSIHTRVNTSQTALQHSRTGRDQKKRSPSHKRNRAFEERGKRGEREGRGGGEKERLATLTLS
jgi:hypothetical protein